MSEYFLPLCMKYSYQEACKLSFCFDPSVFGFKPLLGMDPGEVAYTFFVFGDNYFMQRTTDGKWHFDVKRDGQSWEYKVHHSVLIPDNEHFLGLLHEAKATAAIIAYRKSKLTTILQ